jgi:hypothetical protein
MCPASAKNNQQKIYTMDVESKKKTKILNLMLTIHLAINPSIFKFFKVNTGMLSF